MGAHRHAGRTDVGRLRDGNEDSWGADEQRGLYTVSDGIGGAPAGERASALVVRRLPGLVADESTGDDETRLSQAIVQLNQAMLDEAAGTEDEGMGATVVTVLLTADDPGSAVVGHLGDSRAYRWRAGAIERLTTDHSLAQALVDSGDLTAEAAVGHPTSAQLLRHVGTTAMAGPDVRRVEVVDGDRLLLCTDGLTGLVPDDRIAEVLAEHRDPDDAARVLVDAANAAGGHDNITVLIVVPGF